MSLETTVFIPKSSSLPGPDELRSAAHELGFELDVVDFRPDTHVGSLPVVCNGAEAAVEYYVETVARASGLNLWNRWRMRDFRMQISLVTHSRVDDAFAASVFAAALARSSRGAILDDSSGGLLKDESIGEWLLHNAVEPELLGERTQIREVVEAELNAVIAGLGYRLVSEFPVRHPGDKCYSRDGSTNSFRRYLISSVYFDGADGYCAIDFFISPHSPETLTRRGLEGNIMGVNLFRFMFDHLKRPFDSVLPQNIPVSLDFVESSKAEQLQEELAEADQLVWVRLEEWWQSSA